MSLTDRPAPPDLLSVPIGRWGVAAAPTRIRTLLGSCVGVVLYDRLAKLGGVAHVVLPNSQYAWDHPGKCADTAIPPFIEDLERLFLGKLKGRLTAKIAGGAAMFQTGPAMNIGRLNVEAVEQILANLGIPILARDVGGEAGRRLTLDTFSGIVTIKVPGGDEYQI